MKKNDTGNRLKQITHWFFTLFNFCLFVVKNKRHYFSFIFAFQSLAAIENYVVYYSDKVPSINFLPYDLIVFDSDHHPLLRPLLAKKKIVLGYLSLGEASEGRWYFPKVKKEGLLIEENPNWPGDFFVDLRDKRWQKLVVEEMIPTILNQGFTGLFLDTLDDAEYLEPKYPGMIQAAKELILAIGQNWPDTPLMLNRAFFLLKELPGSFDYIMGESILTGWNSKQKEYYLIPKEEREPQIQAIKNATLKNPKLVAVLLDYWNPKDQNGVKKLYQEQRNYGMVPYVATRDLDRIIVEP